MCSKLLRAEECGTHIQVRSLHHMEERSWEWVVSTPHMRLKGYGGVSHQRCALRRCSAVEHLLLPHGAACSCTEHLLPLRVSRICLTRAPCVCRSSTAEQVPTSRQSAVHSLVLLSSQP